jgi:hypothetical protein
MNRNNTILMVALALLVAGEARAAPKADREEVRRIVVQEALGSRRVPPSLALAVAEDESDFVADAESPAGARGVMQIMPATGRGEFGVRPEELWEPRLNVQIGVAFLDQLIARYGERWDLALSHYNGGSRVGSGEGARVIPATRAYVDKVLRLERRNARDDTVRLMIAAVEDGGMPRAAAAERLPSMAIGAARLATADAQTKDWQPSDRRRRFLALAEAALDDAEDRHQQRGDRVNTTDLLERIDHRKQRFRTLLAALRGG